LYTCFQHPFPIIIISDCIYEQIMLCHCHIPYELSTHNHNRNHNLSSQWFHSTKKNRNWTKREEKFLPTSRFIFTSKIFTYFCHVEMKEEIRSCSSCVINSNFFYQKIMWSYVKHRNYQSVSSSSLTFIPYTREVSIFTRFLFKSINVKKNKLW